MSRRRSRSRTRASKPGRGRVPGWAKALLWAALVAAVGALAARAVGFVPNPFADEREPTGTVEVEGVLTNQTLAMFRGEAVEPAPEDGRGLTLDVTRTAEDASDDGCRLVWTILNANGPTPVSDPGLVNQEAEHVAPDPHSCRTATRVWIAYTAGLAAYDNVSVRVELWDGDQLLDSATSDAISFG